ncbi:PEP/pyruvate-binding domain-containing protein [Mariprofundus sp. KV]|uniref:PEP/pyruvate-binding domain-containing protein n=1 Tax=Mariprofundus sp. KV TaxID=2608715 RepID=UPI0015A4E768|nr:PEP/pyruvate-binding domain-containing protein [Mariprofundus sp. KV]NWF36476.1 phosphoenolpyruvate synthase [Mariprofundus sp. KV]
MILRIFVVISLLFAGSAVAAELDHGKYRSWVDGFKTDNYGPFTQIRWFCNDGSVLPPGENVCSKRGGGRQYGLLGSRAVEMRNQGYLIGNVLAATSPAQFTGPDARIDELSQILLEQFLIRVDDGWVFRRSRFFHRGAVQVEDEQVAATRVLLALLTDPLWRTPERFLLLREAVRRLPLPGPQRLATAIRQAATELGDQDPGFKNLRVKIHSLPDDQDATRVRDYADQAGLPELLLSYAQLAEQLDLFYAPRTGLRQLEQLAGESSSPLLVEQFKETSNLLGAGGDEATIVKRLAARLQLWRQLLQGGGDYSKYDRLRLLQGSLIIETEIFVRGNRLLQGYPEAGRDARIGWLRQLGTALYGTGFLSERQLLAFHGELDELLAADALSAGDYYSRLSYLARLPQWSQQSLAFHFSAAVERWASLTPLSGRLIPDRLRESPLLPYSHIVDHLIADAGRLAGIRHTLFGRQIDSRLRALNPGLQRGVLLQAPAHGEPLRSDGIYILPSTMQDLTPVAGIITSGEGSSLSHVQLLARNMGIPNLVADEALLSAISEHVGERVVLAVSRRGRVVIEQDSPEWERLFGSQMRGDAPLIKASRARLNLDDRRMHALGSLRSKDSGVIAGPKAANLGELHHHYPKLVPLGLVIPFGVFRHHLDKPLFEGGPSVFAWMQSEYARLALIDDEKSKAKQTSVFLGKLRQWIVSTDPGHEFRKQLRFAYLRIFRKSGDRGVFVRSDTNVEDLPGFSGAGLNLTVANVVGMDAIVDAIQQVWASPFSARAYAWRQAHMTDPLHLYPSVLLLQSFDSEKSGVMVTADVDNGSRNWLSVAVSEGVGGAVEGQAAEEIRVERSTGRVRLLTQASVPTKIRLQEGGGIERLQASGRERLLDSDEVEQLRRLAADVKQRFPMPRDAAGEKMAADIEFGFADGKLALFQLRPFVESRRAMQSQLLIEMDRELEASANQRVDLSVKPQEGWQL